jgi:hypothetical protein
MDHNVYRWAANILGDLHELRMEGPEVSSGVADFSQPGPVAVPPLSGMHGKLVEKARLG